MENANAQHEMQVWGELYLPQSQVSEPASGTGNLLDMRQDNHAPLCPSTETDNPVMPFIQPMTLDEWIAQQGILRWQARKAQAMAALEMKGNNNG
jgi:hypothetical protein